MIKFNEIISKIWSIIQQRHKFLRKLLHHETIASALLISTSTIFFGFFEQTLILVFSRLTFLDFSIFLLWQISAISIYILVLYLGLKNVYYRLIYFNIITISFGVALVIVYAFNGLGILKTILIIFFGISFIGNYFSLKCIQSKIKQKQLKGEKVFKFEFNRREILIILLLITLPTVSVVFLTVPRKTIIIRPKTNPEIIFWTDPFNLPDDNETYAVCRKYNINFMPAIGPNSFNRSIIMEKYKLAIANEIKLYFSLITPPDSFINMDNTDEYLSLYKIYKEWFIDEEIFYSEYIKAFVIDAEPPKRYTEKLEDEGPVETVNYFIDDFPTEDEIESATEDVKELVNLIKSDGKEAGIIRITPYMDDFDGDGDIELFLRNIYSLDIKWEYTITMIYRIQRVIADTGATTEIVVSNFMENILGGIVETKEEYVLPAYNFYKRVGICDKECGEIKAGDHYIFIGTLKKEFKDTDYVKDKEYLDDLDICRHFRKEKVFIFNYENFIENYGEKELTDLGEHNQKKKSWKLEYIEAETQATILFYLFMVFIDRIIFLERE